jgi:hypothetical protein
MGISIAGQTIGVPPPFNYRNKIVIFEDFVAGDGSGGANEWSVPAGFSNDSNANWPALVGILKFDWSLASAAASLIAQPRVDITSFQTWDWRCSFRFNGFDTSGGRGQAFGIGIGVDTDGCESNNFLGFRAKGGAGLGGCSAALVADSLVACAEGGTFAGGVYFGSVALAGLINRFVTVRMVYIRAVPSVAFYIDGALVGTCTDSSRIPTTAIGLFNPGFTFAVSAPSALMFFDWFSFSGTLNR